MLILNKPAPLPSQAGSHLDGLTLENALFSYFGCPSDFVYRPVNRLDKGTSGLMIVALDAHTQQLLQSKLHTDQFVRQYLAVTEGKPPQDAGTINLPIGKEKAAGIKRIIVDDGKPSVTHYQVMQTNGERSLLRLQLETGRTHQIRVHLQALGCPICGDFLYGSELSSLPGRFALHSTMINITHPYTNEVLHIESPLPASLEKLMYQESP